jgi:hypothetical protein
MIYLIFYEQTDVNFITHGHTIVPEKTQVHGY